MLLEPCTGTYNFKISLSETKVIGFKEKFIRSKTDGDTILEQLSHFALLGCYISYEQDDDKNQKLNKYQIICSTMQRTLRNQTRNDTNKKF